MIDKVIHFNSPNNILTAICGEKAPRFHTSIVNDITCQFCAYVFACKIREEGEPYLDQKEKRKTHHRRN